MLMPLPKLPLIRLPKGILHLGANTGEELPLYNECNIPKVIWFECNPYIIPYLRMNVERFPGHTVIEAAVSDTDGEVLEFHQTNNNASSSLLKLKEHRQMYPDIVEVATHRVISHRVDTLLTTYHYQSEEFNFANLDLQGAELKALKGMENALRYIDWVYTEVNFKELYEGCCLVGQLDEYLAQFGFKREFTADTNMGWGDALYAKQGMLKI